MWVDISSKRSDRSERPVSACRPRISGSAFLLPVLPVDRNSFELSPFSYEPPGVTEPLVALLALLSPGPSPISSGPTGPARLGVSILSAAKIQRCKSCVCTRCSAIDFSNLMISRFCRKIYCYSKVLFSPINLLSLFIDYFSTKFYILLSKFCILLVYVTKIRLEKFILTLTKYILMNRN